MRTSFIAQLCAALMITSLFLPWFPDPFGGQIVPFRILQQIEPSQISQRLADLPPEGIAFVASFVLAALMLVLGFMGATPRLLAIVMGGCPLALVGWAAFKGYQSAAAASIDGAKPDIAQMLTELAKIFQPGAWLWLGAGTVLFLLALIDRGSPRRR